MVTLMICCFIFWCKVMALEGDEKPKGMPGTSGTENKRPSSEWEKRWEKRWENHGKMVGKHIKHGKF